MEEINMDLQLAGKRAFTSGSTHGIGLAVAASLAREGVHVIINGRGDDSVAGALERIRTEAPGCKADGFSGDLARGEMADKLVRQLPSVDILVNNLGIYEHKPFED